MLHISLLLLCLTGVVDAITCGELLNASACTASPDCFWLNLLSGTVTVSSSLDNRIVSTEPFPPLCMDCHVPSGVLAGESFYLYFANNQGSECSTSGTVRVRNPIAKMEGPFTGLLEADISLGTAPTVQDCVNKANNNPNCFDPNVILGIVQDEIINGTRTTYYSQYASNNIVYGIGLNATQCFCASNETGGLVVPSNNFERYCQDCCAQPTCNETWYSVTNFVIGPPQSGSANCSAAGTMNTMFDSVCGLNNRTRSPTLPPSLSTFPTAFPTFAPSSTTNSPTHSPSQTQTPSSTNIPTAMPTLQPSGKSAAPTCVTNGLKPGLGADISYGGWSVTLGGIPDIELLEWKSLPAGLEVVFPLEVSVNVALQLSCTLCNDVIFTPYEVPVSFTVNFPWRFYGWRLVKLVGQLVPGLNIALILSEVYDFLTTAYAILQRAVDAAKLAIAALECSSLLQQGQGRRLLQGPFIDNSSAFNMSLYDPLPSLCSFPGDQAVFESLTRKRCICGTEANSTGCDEIADVIQLIQSGAIRSKTILANEWSNAVCHPALCTWQAAAKSVLSTRIVVDRVAFQDFDNRQAAAALTKIHSAVTSSGLEIRAISPQPSNKVQINLESKNVTAISLPIVASQLRALVREELGLNFTFESVDVNYTGEWISSAHTLHPLLALLPCVYLFLNSM